MDNAFCVAIRPLTVPSGNPDSSATHSLVHEPAQRSSHASDPSVRDEGASDFKSIATSKARLSLFGVKESLPGFPPLTSVAGFLHSVLDGGSEV